MGQCHGDDFLAPVDARIHGEANIRQHCASPEAQCFQSPTVRSGLMSSMPAFVSSNCLAWVGEHFPSQTQGLELSCLLFWLPPWEVLQGHGAPQAVEGGVPFGEVRVIVRHL